MVWSDSHQVGWGTCEAAVHQERGPGLLLTLALEVLWAKDRLHQLTSSALEQVLHSGCL